MCFLFFYVDINFWRLFWEFIVIIVVRVRIDFVGWIIIWYIEGIYGFNYGLYSYEDILVYDFDEVIFIRIRVFGFMDNFYLFDEGVFVIFFSFCNYNR